MTKVTLNSEQIEFARKAIREIEPSLEPQYLTLIHFLADNPEFRGKIRGKNPPEFATFDYFKKTASIFANGRLVSRPKNSGKTPDPLLTEVFGKMNRLQSSEVKTAVKYHGDFMVIENMVGKIVEHYIASKLEPKGWVWCSGDFVAKVDFIFPNSDGDFEVLQIKNKDVTENSSSIVGRGSIPKWVRLKGKKAKANWDQFPNVQARNELSEEDFLAHGVEIGKTLFDK